MPLYKYAADDKSCDHCREGFEALQGLKEPPLAKCPECGQPCRRIISTFAAIKSERDTLSPSNLARKGFTQYKKAGDGHYEKTCGDGPQVINNK